MDTKLGYQLLGNPPDRFKAFVGSGKIIKIVGDQNDIAHLNDWPNVPIRQARLITAEPAVTAARDRNSMADIPALAADTAKQYAAVEQAIGLTGKGVFWEVPPIMPAVSKWIGEWNAGFAEQMAQRGLHTVCFGFATGTPQVKPFATAQQPDEWPTLYPYLARLNALGDWTRIGVEEYVTGGILLSGDYSNVGRIRRVWENHLVPNGWTKIKFRGIEGSFDVPGTHDIKNMTPTYFWQQMKLVDAAYSALPYFDAMALYVVYDPTTNPNEAKFALTPGEPTTKAKPIFVPGYLDVGATYFAANPPAKGTDQPPTIPPPNTPPTTPPSSDWTRLVLDNDGFEGGEHFDLSDRFGQRHIPDSWQLAWLLKQGTPEAELEHHPSHVQEGQASARIHGVGAWRGWYWRKIKIPANSQVRVTVSSLGTATDVVDAPSRKGEVVSRVVAIDPFGRDWPSANQAALADDSLIRDEAAQQLDPPFIGQQVTAIANGDMVTILLDARHGDTPYRADVFWDHVIVEVKATDTPPPPVPPPSIAFPFQVVVVGVNTLNLRPQPSSDDTLSPSTGLTYVGKTWWVDALSEDGKWYRLRGQDKWIARQFTRPI